MNLTTRAGVEYGSQRGVFYIDRTAELALKAKSGQQFESLETSFRKYFKNIQGEVLKHLYKNPSFFAAFLFTSAIKEGLLDTQIVISLLRAFDLSRDISREITLYGTSAEPITATSDLGGDSIRRNIEAYTEPVFEAELKRLQKLDGENPPKRFLEDFPFDWPNNIRKPRRRMLIGFE